MCLRCFVFVFSISSYYFFVSCVNISSGTTDGFFWHVTDIHVDQNYSRTGNPNDLCHSDGSTFSDNGLYGNFLCDSPEYLVNITVKSMKDIKSNPDFIIWTGDNLPHTRSFDPDWDVVFKGIKNVTTLLRKSFPNVPVYPSIGNHDTFPPNILLPNATSNSIYEGYLKKGGWNKLLPEETWSTFSKGGFYTVLIRPGLRLISLNTILWYFPNHYTGQLMDPGNQFTWLKEVLKNSTLSSEKIYIIGHVPPGYYNRVKPGERSDPTYHSQHQEAYLKLLLKYSDIIFGQMFGHLHIDMFQLFQCDTGVFKSSAVLASSVTPWHMPSSDNISIPVNPSIRLMHYSRSNGLLKDYNQFYLNLTKANTINDTEVQNKLYDLLYTFTDAYSVPDLSTPSLVQVYEKLKTDEVLFDKFFKFSTAGKESVVCDSFCKVAQLCSIACTSNEEYNFCMQNHQNGSNYVCFRTSEDNNYILLYALIAIMSAVFFFLIIYTFWRRKPLQRGFHYESFSSF